VANLQKCNAIITRPYGTFIVNIKKTYMQLYRSKSGKNSGVMRHQPGKDYLVVQLKAGNNYVYNDDPKYIIIFVSH
jgi:hypothetical protein